MDWRNDTAPLPVMSYQLAATIHVSQPPDMPIARGPWTGLLLAALGWLFIIAGWVAVIGAVWLKEGIS